ncbi:hypothetical protein [Pseudomonas chlororaphis]|uniref:hypothetical protein n=1 Tax=Pseudomonas chlororaphis TaxID=587753 RepID=UPI0039DF82A0
MAMPVDGARLIQDVLAELNWDADANAIAERVRRLDIGLPLEDEFSVVCAWLGKCELIHKLDQQQVPVSSVQKYQVPDLLARFTTQTNSTPLLIEVKSNKKNVLSFTPDYLERLQNYASLVGMPLLVAWKFHSVWMLFEVRHMKKANKNFNIALEMAMKQNLLGVLAGDVAYSIGEGVGVNLRFRKDRLVDVKETETGCTQQWEMTVDEVDFTDREGNRRKGVDREIQSLLAAWDLEEQEEHTDTHIYLRFLAGNEGIQFAHKALVQLLNWESPNNDRLHWRSLLRREQITSNVACFSTALDTALREGFVTLILNQQPHDVPDFLHPQ